MVKQIFICDCCGKEIRENFYRMDTEEVDQDGIPISGDKDQLYDVCFDCFKKWTENPAHQEPEPVKEAPKEKPDKRKKVDSGKIIALWNAKWSSYEISKEMGISIPTVNKYIRIHMEGGKDGED